MTGIAGFGCMWLRFEWEFILLQVVLAFGGTGTFAFGRSILSDLTPPAEGGLVFGLYTIVSRTAGALGPLAFGFVVQQTGSPRMGFLVVVSFLVLGSALLALVETPREDEAETSEVGEFTAKGGESSETGA